MTRVHGKNMVVTLDGDDLTAHSNNVEFVRTADSHDLTVFGNNSHVYEGGLGDGTVTLTGVYDSTAVTGPRAIIEPMIGTRVPMVHKPEGTGVGKPQDTVNVVVTSYTESTPVADYIRWTLELQMSGDVTTIAQV